MTLTINFNAAGKVMKAPAVDEQAFELESSTLESDIVTPGSTVNETYDDKVLEKNTGATFDPVYEVALNDPLENTRKATLTNLTPTIASRDVNSGVVTRLQDGTATFVARNAFHGRTASLDMTRSIGAVTYTFVDDAAGSAAEESRDSLYALLTGEPSAKLPVFSNWNHETLTYNRNTSCLLKNITGLTGLSVGTDIYGATHWRRWQRQCAVVHEEFGLAAKHFPPSVGSDVYYVTRDNVTVTRTVIARSNVGGDVQLIQFDSALPASIEPLKVFPADYANYFPRIDSPIELRHAYSVPVVSIMSEGGTTTTQDRTCGLYSLYDMLSDFASGTWSIGIGTPDVNGWYKDEFGRDGDSGCVMCMVMDSCLVGMGGFYFPSSGYNWAAYYDAIETAMTTLAGASRSLNPIDLSSYTDYSA